MQPLSRAFFLLLAPDTQQFSLSTAGHTILPMAVLSLSFHLESSPHAP